MFELKPCPFCGCSATIVESKYPKRFHPCCTNLDCILYPGAKWFKKKKEAVSEWNRRAREDG